MNNLEAAWCGVSGKILSMIVLRHLVGWTVSAFSSREYLILENLALRQQLLALHAKRPLCSAKTPSGYGETLMFL
jgi:hypothetical protein